MWKKVDEAQNKGLPKTAIELLEPIIQGAIRDKAWPEAIKAIARKIALEGVIQGNKPEEKILRLEEEISKAPREMAPVMEAVLANWYWHFFQQNRWRFMRRTQTAEPPGKDILTWDLPRILAEIDRVFTRALSAEAELKKIPVADYDALLEKGTLPDTYRPTLYDFVAFEALNFYSSGEQAAAKAEDAFELAADSPIFAPAEEFLKWEVKTTDETSLTAKAIRLYQKVLSFHRDDADKSAFIDADLNRLQFGYNRSVGEDRNKRYKDALKAFVDRWGDHEISARARFLWASVLRSENELVEARRIALQGWEAFRNSVGGRMCHNLVRDIEAKSVSIATERVWNQPWPTIEVRYRNVTEVFFRLVPLDWKGRIGNSRWRPEQLTGQERDDLVRRKPAYEWSRRLPPTEDYRERVEELPIPEDLKPGCYFLIASHDPKFGDKDNVVSVTDIWVSTLAIVMRNRHGEDLIEGFVLDAASGEPVQNAKVETWIRDNNGRFSAGPSVATDQNGLFSLRGSANRGYLLLASSGEQQLAAGNDYYLHTYGRKPEPYTRTVFFTDRALYRPGQTVNYKGICIRVDTEADNYTALAGQNVTVVFKDPNGKEISRQQHRTNDYGSFSGSFTAPRDRLTGRMILETAGGPTGSASVSVEEYKRPKFQVTLEAPETASKLGQKVTLKGKAMAYTGAAIDGAKVRWRVVREVRYPDWWHWYFWWRAPRTASQEIAHGTATTGVDGGFTVEFVAKPDLSVPEKDEPTFVFSVYADVTDTAGETRSAQRSVSLGYAAITASMSAPQWLTDDKPVEISIFTRTLDGVGQKTDVAVKVYRLKQPEKVVRPKLPGWQPGPRFGREADAGAQPPPDPSNPNSWELGEVVFEQGLTTDAGGRGAVSAKLAPGAYRAMLEAQDPFGRKITARLPLQVLKPDARQFPVKVPSVVAAPKWSLEVGEEFMALWGTGYEKARAFIEIEHRRKVIQSFWTELGATQQTVRQQITEAMRGGFTLRVTMVRENRAYLTSHRVDVPWTNKKLTVAWERFVSKLEPGQKETWTAVVSGPDAKRAVAEMVAALYDQSLDQFLAHQWISGFGVFRQDASNLYSQFENMRRGLWHLRGSWDTERLDATCTWRHFPVELTANLWGYMYFRGGAPGRRFMEERQAAQQFNGVPAPAAAAAVADRETDKLDGFAENAARKSGADEKLRALAAQPGETAGMGGGGRGEPGGGAGPDLDKVSARVNLNETAFFFPHLVSDKDGVVRMEFTMPEALTQWKFLGFAHDATLRGGLLQDSAVTAKELMVQPNPPRFVREGDALEFTVKITNQSAGTQSVSARLTFFDLRTGRPVDDALGNTQIDRKVDIPAKESRTVSWRITVPDELAPVGYKAVASTGRLSDGEEGAVPVLSRRVLVTESLPLPVRGQQTKRFSFTKLAQAGQSPTLRHQSLTVQVVSNPAWYAVMALPYIMEFPYECTEQTFNRLYANSLARHIANSDPKIRRVFEQWKGTPALDSPLEKNQDLKAVMLEETPWLRQAVRESEARRNVGILFDENRLNSETQRLMQKIAEAQLADGAWPWFPGGPANDYITLYITTGFGRLRHLGVKQVDAAPAIKALARLDGWINRIYQDILRAKRKDEYNLSPTIAFYLYGRSFFLEDRKIAPEHKEAVDYFLAQARKHWLMLANRQSQAHLAVALKRFGDADTARAIMASIKERSVTSEEMGMFWRDTELSWWWYRAPIETQAMMIEAFDEVMADAAAVEECRVWLIKQKQTQDWKTSKATADAIYGLLLRGGEILSSTELVEVTLGDVPIKPEKVEAGTGFYEQRFLRTEIKPEFSQIVLKKNDKGVAWGSIHWQYLEDMSKVTPWEGTPLKLEKALFTRELTARGPVLQPVKGPVKVGDELVVRIVLRVDRDMEYVHLKDHRASGTEPVNVLSRYRYQDGLAYYEATRDTASHFFIDYLPKGTYVFEYPVRVQHRGRYQTGMASIQCMYAPEFNSHSQSFVLEVQ